LANSDNGTSRLVDGSPTAPFEILDQGEVTYRGVARRNDGDDGSLILNLPALVFAVQSGADQSM
jgi:hypothetical protein